MDCRPVALLGGASTLGATIAYQLAAQGYTPIIIDHNQASALDIVAHEPRVRFKSVPALTVDALTAALSQSVSQLAPLTGVVQVAKDGERYMRLLGYPVLDQFCQADAACVMISPHGGIIKPRLDDIPDTNFLQRINSVTFWLDHNFNSGDETLSVREKCEVLSPLVCFLLGKESKRINNQVFSVKL
jgi:NAD(P)-dependent dehydrogenase (short-subunit alcohol dehydrogenase family)